MAFDEAFTDLRKRRRIPMRGFEEPAGIPSSYISAIEKGELLPSQERLDELVAVFESVAREQEAADPEKDARILHKERDSSLFERLGLEPELAEFFAALKERAGEDMLDNLNSEEQARLVEAVRVVTELDSEQRAALLEAAEVLTESESEARTELLHDLANRLEGLREPVGENGRDSAHGEVEREALGAR